MSTKTLKKKLWTLTSQYIRRKYSDPHTEMCTCVTCGTVKHWKELQAGHFVPKAKGLSVYFVEENIHPQCVSCNVFNSGNLIEYTRYMIDMYGIEKVDELRALANTPLKLSKSDYEAMIAEIEEKLLELDKRANTPQQETSECE